MMEKLTPNDYPIHDLLRRRWSPRAFADLSVWPARFRSLLEAARWAPSSYNEQPWALIVATKDQSAEFAKVLSCLVEGNQAWAKFAPVLMLSFAHLTFDRNQQPNRHAYHDVGLAIANLTLQATADGLAVHQMAGIQVDKIRTTFAVPEDWDPVTGIAIGYLGDPTNLPEQLQQRELSERVRKPLASFVFSGDWGKVAPVIAPRQ
jgi:nitroreductase